MKPRKKKTIILTIALLCLLAGCQQESQPEHTSQDLPKLMVTTTQVQLVNVPNQIEILGTVESKFRAEISSKISGTITTLPVVLGSEVHTGDLLLELSAGEIDAKLQRSQAELNQARRNLERERKLRQKDAATLETVKSHIEKVAIAEAAFEEARIIQTYTKILAPINGKITRKMSNIGDLATPGKPLLHIEDELHLQIITDIPEALILRMQKGNVLQVSIPSADLTVAATVAEVAPTANPTTRSAPVKLDIEAHPRLRPGQFARVAISLEQAETLTIPKNVLSRIGQMERVFIVENGRARLRLVRSGADFGDAIEIISGLVAGEQVIVSDNMQVKDGQPVAVQ